MKNTVYLVPTDTEGRFNFESTVIMLSKAYASEWAIPNYVIQKLKYARQNYELRYIHEVNRNLKCVCSNEELDAAWDFLEKQLIDLFDNYLIDNIAISDEYKAVLYIH